MAILLNFYLYANINGYFNITTTKVFRLNGLFLLEIEGMIVLSILQRYLRDKTFTIAEIPIIHFLVIFGIYFVANAISHFTLFTNNSYQRHLIDLLFYLAISYITFKEFAFNKARLVVQSRQLQQQVNDVEIGKNVARIAHDLRKPFQNVRIYLDTLSKSNLSEIEILKLNSRLMQSISLSENLIAEILNKKRNDILRMETVNIKDFVNEVKSMFIEELSRKQVEVTLSVVSDFNLSLDKAKFLAVFQNILNNAEECFLRSQKTKKIWFKVRSEKNSLGEDLGLIIIGNNGPAIPEHILHKLFQSTITFGKQSGTGLGLMGVKSIIDLHFGDIKARNLTFNQGVEFEISIKALPLDYPILNLDSKEHEAQIKCAAPDIKSKPERKQISQLDRIALIDDDDLIHRSWDLVWPNNQILHFKSPDEFLRQLATQELVASSFDLIICDLFFDNDVTSNGIDLASKLRAQGFDNIVLCTGSQRHEIEKPHQGLFLAVLPKQVWTIQQLIGLLS